MRKVVVCTNLSLDGVMQSPARADEDQRSGFQHGGWGELVRSLMGAQVIDEFVLLIHPIVVGEGTRLFADAGPFVKLALINSTTTPNGVVIATYHPEAAA